MSRYNTSTSHPIIPNAQQYMFEQKYVSIHSEDRDIVKYPCSSDFEIELPQDYCNVQAVKLQTWSFPNTHDVFLPSRFNVKMSFSFLEITSPYAPDASELQINIYNGLIANLKNEYTIIISSGSYAGATNAGQEAMAKEIQNRMNESVTNYLLKYLNGIGRNDLITLFVEDGGYQNFIVQYNLVTSKLWFGNNGTYPNGKFVIHNTEENVFLRNASLGKFQYPVYSLWGLGAYLGFNKNQPIISIESPFISNVNKYEYPRFYYIPGGQGYWLTYGYAYGEKPVYYLETPCLTNIDGPHYFYMDVDLLNNMDELVPYELNNFTTHTNESSGIVNSAFAKVTVANEFLASQTIDVSVASYKLFNPPAERMRKLRIRFRYHNGLLVNFENKGFTFTLQFTLFRPQNQRTYNMYVPETVVNPPIG